MSEDANHPSADVWRRFMKRNFEFDVRPPDFNDLSEDDIDVFLSEDLPDADLLAGIDFVQSMLSVTAIPRLVDLLENPSRPYEVRNRASEAIAALGAYYVRSILESACQSNDAITRELAAKAIGCSGPHRH